MRRGKDNILVNLKKTKTLVGTIEEMVRQDRYCVDIMQQVLASIGLLRAVHKELMVKHLHGCFVEALKTGSKKRKEEMIKEILKVIDFYNK